MAIEVYRAQAMEKARSALGRYRGQIESGIGQAQTVATVGAPATWRRGSRRIGVGRTARTSWACPSSWPLARLAGRWP